MSWPWGALCEEEEHLCDQFWLPRASLRGSVSGETSHKALGREMTTQRAPSPWSFVPTVSSGPTATTSPPASGLSIQANGSTFTKGPGHTPQSPCCSLPGPNHPWGPSAPLPEGCPHAGAEEACPGSSAGKPGCYWRPTGAVHRTIPIPGWCGNSYVACGGRWWHPDTSRTEALPQADGCGWSTAPYWGPWGIHPSEDSCPSPSPGVGQWGTWGPYHLSEGGVIALKGHPVPSFPQDQLRPLLQSLAVRVPPFAHPTVLASPCPLPWCLPKGAPQHTSPMIISAGTTPSMEEQVNSRSSVYWGFLDNTHTQYTLFSTGSTKKCWHSASTDWQMSLGTQTSHPCVHSHIINFITRSFLPWAFSFSPSMVTGHWQRPVILLLYQHTRKFVKHLKWLGKIPVVTWDRKSSTLSTISQWFLIKQ